MRPIFQAELVNRPFGDPGVYVDLKFERRALLFDIGEISALPTRKLLRISDVFVSHTHMDHFAGFDHLLRVCLGRDTGGRLYGPAGFIEQVGHKLAAYTWNLIESYSTDFLIQARELRPDGTVLTARFRSKRRFQREDLPASRCVDGLLLQERHFAVRAAMLDHHGIVSLAFRFEEGMHMNVWKSRLEELGLPTGPWLTELKRKVREGAPDDSCVRVRWRTREGSRERTYALGDLRRKVLQYVPGQTVCYVTDVAGHERNVRALVDFLRDADLVFIEAVFLEVDRDQAQRKAHLTARGAGAIARAAGVRSAVPFHFSPRYFAREGELRAEFEASRSADSASM